jgi:succinate dehydrogenase / fumarate reductase, cytochrome b subunit
MTNPAAKSRPEFRNIHVSQLLQYKLPPPGLPFILWLFDLSLTSELSYARLAQVGSNVLVKVVLVGLAWAYLHHLIAGVRYLMLDLHVGLDKPVARTSAIAVYWISLPLSLIAALKIFGAF